jgi:hypothetical protein
MSSVRWALAAALSLGLSPAGRGQEPVDPTFRSDLLNRVVDGEGMLPSRWLNREEVLAYEKLVLHARQFSDSDLGRAARRDLRVPVLLGPDKAKYRGTIFHLKGSLRLVQQMALSAGLEGMDERLTHVYRGWIELAGVKDELGPVLCAVDFTELTPGVPADGTADERVRVDGYFFKVMKYDTRENMPAGVSDKSPEGKVQRLAPLFIARTIKPQMAVSGSGNIWDVPGAVVGGSIVLVGAAAAAWFVVAWWLKRGDAKVRARLAALRSGGGETGPPSPPDHLSPEGSGAEDSSSSPPSPYMGDGAGA